MHLDGGRGRSRADPVGHPSARAPARAGWNGATVVHVDGGAGRPATIALCGLLTTQPGEARHGSRSRSRSVMRSRSRTPRQQTSRAPFTQPVCRHRRAWVPVPPRATVTRDPLVGERAVLRFPLGAWQALQQQEVAWCSRAALSTASGPLGPALLVAVALTRRSPGANVVLIANVRVGLSGSHERSTAQTSVAAPRAGGPLVPGDLGGSGSQQARW